MVCQVVCGSRLSLPLICYPLPPYTIPVQHHGGLWLSNEASLWIKTLSFLAEPAYPDAITKLSSSGSLALLVTLTVGSPQSDLSTCPPQPTSTQHHPGEHGAPPTAVNCIYPHCGPDSQTHLSPPFPTSTCHWSLHQDRRLFLGLGGVLASPASGQKSSLGLAAWQTAAKAEWNLNVDPLQREAKERVWRRVLCHLQGRGAWWLTPIPLDSHDSCHSLEAGGMEPALKTGRTLRGP